MDRLGRVALRLAMLVAVAGGLFVAGQRVSFGELARVLRSTNVVLLVASALPILGVGFALRAGRFRAVIGKTPLSFPRTISSMLLTQAANNILPLRVGELVKTRDFVAAGHAPGRVIAAQGAEKLVEATTLVLTCTPAIAIHLGYRTRVLAVTSIAVALFLPLLAWIARRLRIQPSELGAAFVWSLAVDVFEIALVTVTLRSLGLAAGLGTSLTILGAVNLAIALPSTPGNAGAFEAGAALGLVALGVTHDAALAFALLYRAIQWVPVTTAGAIVWAYRLARGAASTSLRACDCGGR
jgi:uncharacterized membrane protein YbhN (UPF0104 family)